MGTTGTYGLPFPEDTDPVAQGAAAIEALAEAVEDTLANSDLSIAADPIVHSDSTAWNLGDFGGATTSGDTYQTTRVREGVAEAWGLAVLNDNGPAFAPGGQPAKFTWIKLPVAPTDLRTRHVVGTWFFVNPDDNPLGSGILRYDPEHVSGEHWARLSSTLNTTFQGALGFHLRYPLDMP